MAFHRDPSPEDKVLHRRVVSDLHLFDDKERVAECTDVYLVDAGFERLEREATVGMSVS